MEHQSNKNIVAQFYKQIIGQRNTALINTYVRENYIQHSANGKDGREGLLEMVTFLKTLPKPVEAGSPVKMLIADGDMVSALLDINFMGKRMLVIDLFRVEENMLAEHWDAVQEISKDVAIENIIADESADATANKNLISRLFTEDVLHEDLKLHNDIVDVKLQRVIAEGNIVVALSKLTLNGELFALYDIFKVTNNAIEECWSITQAVPDHLMHSNGMF